MWELKHTSNIKALVPQLTGSSSPGDPHGKEGTSLSLPSQWAGLGPVCRESRITMLRQAAFLQHVFSDLQTLPIKLLQMSCLIPTLAWQQLHCQCPIRQHCPLILSNKVKHCGGAESRLREEQKGCKAYYRDGNAEPSFAAWTWPLHLLHTSSMQCLTKYPYGFPNISCTIKATPQVHFFLHCARVEQKSSTSWLVFTPSQEIKGDLILTADIHLLICSCQHSTLGSRKCISVLTE